MANKQSVPMVNLKGANLQQTVKGVPLIRYIKHEKEDVNTDIKNIGMILGGSFEAIKSQQKKLSDDEKSLQAAALLNVYRQGLKATQTPNDFEALAGVADNLIKADFDDDESKDFWLEHGQKILDANREDTEKLREIKSVEFGKNSLNQLLADAQNMIALVPNGDKYLEMGGEEIAQSVFLSEAEKEKYQYNFYKNGILNLALQDADAAEAARVKYLVDDEGLESEIKKISELRLKAIEQQQQEQQKREDFAAQKEGVFLWQKKQTGMLDEASYYVLAKGVGARFGDEENAKGNITEAYQVLKRLNEGEKLFDEEIFAANQALISAYDEGKAGFEEVVFAQNFLFDKEGQNNRGVDRAINELMDRIMLPDAEEQSLEAEAFMEEKAKLALKVSEAYYARKNELIGEAKEQGKTISLGVLTACARKAMHEVRDMFDFAEDEEGISFAELKNELEENYPNADKAVVWKEFAKRAPYARDKSGLIKRIADVQNGIKLAENEYAGVVSDGMVETEVLSDDEIFQIKSKLSQLGYYQGEIDGHMTSQFRLALDEYSKDNYLEDVDTPKRIIEIEEKLKEESNLSHVNFDGQCLQFIENGKITLQVPAMSGRTDYQNRKYQSLKNKGPIPEGKYKIKQSNIQKVENTILEQLGRGKSPGGWNSWGKYRVWLDAFSSNNMYNREKLSIHGGKELGSAGCIDLGKNEMLFFDKLREYGKDIVLTVRYPNQKLR